VAFEILKTAEVDPFAVLMHLPMINSDPCLISVGRLVEIIEAMIRHVLKAIFTKQIAFALTVNNTRRVVGVFIANSSMIAVQCRRKGGYRLHRGPSQPANLIKSLQNINGYFIKKSRF
jgi:hypothetical protein